MNARLESLDISNPGAVAAPRASRACCSRSAGVDEAPAVIALLVTAVERGTKRFSQGVQSALRGAAYLRQ